MTGPDCAVMCNLINTERDRQTDRKRVALAGTLQLSSQGLVLVHAHRTEGIPGSEGREETRGQGRDQSRGRERRWERGRGRGWSGNGNESEGGDERRSARGNEEGNGGRAGTGTGVETRGRT